MFSLKKKTNQRAFKTCIYRLAVKLKVTAFLIYLLDLYICIDKSSHDF